MKKHLILKWYSFFICLNISLSSVYANQTWDGTSSPPANVLDEDLFIDGSLGTIQLQNGTTTDPVVSGVAGSSPVLLLQANNGNAINFSLNGVNQNLTFQGPAASTTPLLIIATTDGAAGSRVNFQLGDGNSLSLEPNGTATAGVQMYMWMQDLGAEAPTTLFSRASNGANATMINIRNLCVLSYLSSQAHNVVASPTNTGRFLFDPTNTGSGRFVVDINDGGAVVVEGHATNGVTDPLLMTFADIQRNIPAGLRAFFEVTSASSGSLVVMNSNSQQFGLLVDPFGNEAVSGSYTGLRLGYVLGAAGALTVDSNTYFDYVGLYQSSLCPTTTFVPNFPNVNPESLLKGRNPSAFFVDGTNPLFLASSTAIINLQATSGLYLRSGVDSLGNANTDFTDPNVFTINPLNQSSGAGALVFDVEGPLRVNGSGIAASKIELLSWQVAPTGGPLQPGGVQTTFPLRTFAVDGLGKFLQYNKGAMLINNTVNLHDVSLDHTDELHKIYQDNAATSEPTYIGGEAWNIKGAARPNFRFANAALNVYTNIAFTGVDLVVSNQVDSFLSTNNNSSQFVYYYSGRLVEDSTGRMMIMGTQVGSTACNDCTVVSRDAHIDVLQTNVAAAPGIVDTLTLDVGLNTAEIDDRITGSIAGQFGIHTIFLGNNSNISIGNQVAIPSSDTVQSILFINGNYFSFTTQGGMQGIPALSGVTGDGGIFVDSNGSLTISPNVRASIAAMVVQSGNSIVNLPKNQILFGDTVGITNWKLDLSTTSTIINLSTVDSDYSLNWINVTKDYAGGFIPYEPLSVNQEPCPAVVPANIYNIPTVLGEVDQLQIQGSRIGDQVHLKVDGGHVRELIFQRAGGYSAQASVAFLVLQNDGRVGLGTALRNVDSFEGPFMLGINGVTLVANGNGQVDLNENMLVNNVCSILKGPNNVTGNVLRINADVPQEFRIRKEAVLDLTQFVAGDTIEFTGNVKVILEPGATIITSGANIVFSDETILFAEPYAQSEDIFDAIPHDFNHNSFLDGLVTATAALAHNQFAPLFGTGEVTNTDPFRVRLIGTGKYLFANNSSFFIPKYAFVGIETLDATFNTTDLTIELQDNADFVIGDAIDHYTLGGSFQVGNTTNQSNNNASIQFTLSLQSAGTHFSVHPQGFVGFNVGIVDKRMMTPKNWLVDTLYNVGNITLNINDGVFDHSRTFSGLSPIASLMAFGPAAYTWILEPDSSVASDRSNQVAIHGGGNIALIHPASSGLGAYHPVVIDDSPGAISPVIQTGILASRLMITLPAIVGYDAQTMFNISRVQEITAPTAGQSIATAAYTNEKDPVLRRSLTAGFVNNLKIGRNIIFDIADSFGGLQEDRLVKAAALGAVGVQLNNYAAAPGKVVFAQQLP